MYQKKHENTQRISILLYIPLSNTVFYQCWQSSLKTGNLWHIQNVSMCWITHRKSPLLLWKLRMEIIIPVLTVSWTQLKFFQILRLIPLGSVLRSFALRVCAHHWLRGLFWSVCFSGPHGLWFISIYVKVWQEICRGNKKTRQWKNCAGPTTLNTS